MYKKLVFVIVLFVAFILCGAVSAADTTTNSINKNTAASSPAAEGIVVQKIDSGSKTFYDSEMGKVKFGYKTYKYSKNYVKMYGCYYLYRYSAKFSMTYSFIKTSPRTLKFTAKVGSETKTYYKTTGHSALYWYWSTRSEFLKGLTNP